MTISAVPNQGITLLTVAEAATRLGLGRTRVFGLIREGELEAVSFGRRTTRIPSDAVDGYIARAREHARRAARA